MKKKKNLIFFFIIIKFLLKFKKFKKKFSQKIFL
jgi:hypothetical protein